MDDFSSRPLSSLTVKQGTSPAIFNKRNVSISTQWSTPPNSHKFSALGSDTCSLQKAAMTGCQSYPNKQSASVLWACICLLRVLSIFSVLSKIHPLHFRKHLILLHVAVCEASLVRIHQPVSLGSALPLHDLSAQTVSSVFGRTGWMPKWWEGLGEETWRDMKTSNDKHGHTYTWPKQPTRSTRLVISGKHCSPTPKNILAYSSWSAKCSGLVFAR